MCLGDELGVQLGVELGLGVAAVAAMVWLAV